MAASESCAGYEQSSSAAAVSEAASESRAGYEQSSSAAAVSE